MADLTRTLGDENSPSLEGRVEDGPLTEVALRRASRLQPLARLAPRWVQVDWLDLRDRSVFFASWSIGASLAMAGWKIGAAVFASTSLFWLASAAFSIGLAAAKYLAVRAHRKPAAGTLVWQHRTYRLAGVFLVLLAGLYIASCVTMVVGGGATQRYDSSVGIAIAALTFTELGLAISGLLSARRQSDLLVEVIKLSNLAGALVLLVLTQSALMSFSNATGEDPHTTGLAGVVFGSVAGLIGLYMLVRRLPTARLESVSRRR